MHTVCIDLPLTYINTMPDWNDDVHPVLYGGVCNLKYYLKQRIGTPHPVPGP